MITETQRDYPDNSSGTALFGHSWLGTLFGSPAAWASFAAGLLTLFTISIGGEMPLGEIILVLTAGLAILCTFFNRAWPCALLQNRFLWVLLAAQFIGLCGYIFSDLYRHSFPRDMARGWSRMVFLAIDIIAIVYLFGRSPRNLTVFLIGQCVGCVASAIMFGPLFGDMWKFGIGMPVTLLLFIIVPWAGSTVTTVAAAALGLAHFVLGFRSMGSLSLLTAILTFLQGSVPVKSRLWLAPFAAAITAAVVMWTSARTSVQDQEHTSRSNVERSAMITAAVEAIKKSPVIGYGSWFSNTDVYDNFMLIRKETAREAEVGGFPQEYEDEGTTAIHSQFLVAIAEGGIFGATFFYVFGAGLLLSLFKLVFCEEWHRLAPLCVILLLSALWNLFFSPFSGAERVYIAMACGLILLLRSDGFYSHQNEDNENEYA